MRGAPRVRPVYLDITGFTTPANATNVCTDPPYTPVPWPG